MTSSSKHILDVGQCGVDGPRLGRFLTREFKCVVIDRAHSKDQALALAAAKNYDLALVNRLLDRDRSRGVDVIAALLAANPALKVMLISDRVEAQQEAIRHGALPGFGKATLETPETEQLLHSVLKSC